MTSGRFRFGRYLLDLGDRQLRRGDEPVELNSRYLDALALLVREQGTLVSKDRFLDEVWRGVPVTDEALTQCIRTLRRQLGDDAASPSYIETVPKHGYRFIAPVERVDGKVGAAFERSRPGYSWREFVLLGLAGTVGGAVAGVVGGLVYGLAGASHPLAPGMGAVSVLLVLLCATIFIGLLGGAGVAFGIAAAGFAPSRLWTVAGGAVGGLIVGAVVKLVGLDAFTLFVGRSPGDITGPFEGALLGAATGVGAWLASPSLRRTAALAAVTAGAAGALIVLAGGRMLGGSLDLFERSFPGSRLRLDRIGAAFGESGFGPVTQTVTGALEAALFAACVLGAMAIARRSLGANGS